MYFNNSILTFVLTLCTVFSVLHMYGIFLSYCCTRDAFERTRVRTIHSQAHYRTRDACTHSRQSYEWKLINCRVLKTELYLKAVNSNNNNSAQLDTKEHRSSSNFILRLYRFFPRSAKAEWLRRNRKRRCCDATIRMYIMYKMFP